MIFAFDFTASASQRESLLAALRLNTLGTTHRTIGMHSTLFCTWMRVPEHRPMSSHCPSVSFVREADHASPL